MPEVRKLTPAEVETLERTPSGQRRQIEDQYDALLSDYAVGEYGEALLEGDEKRLTVRNRLRAAAVRRGIGLDFKHSGADRLRFQVIEAATSAPEASAPVPSTPALSVSAEMAATPSSQVTTRRKRSSMTTTAGTASAEAAPARTRRRSSKRLEQVPPRVVSVPAIRAPASGIAADDAPEPKKRHVRPKKTA
jgi:hypothetical protein